MCLIIWPATYSLKSFTCDVRYHTKWNISSPWIKHNYKNNTEIILFYSTNYKLILSQKYVLPLNGEKVNV